MKNIGESLFYITLGYVICLLINFGFETTKSVAIIQVTDRAGNPVRVKPKVVCLAERPNETLICRVEAVR